MTVRRRQKASDVFRDAELLFGSKTSNFSKAFPEIKDIEVKVREEGRGLYSGSRTGTYTRANFPGQYVDCSNTLCYNGGFSLGNLVHGMTYSRKQEEEWEHIFCQGHEGSPKGRRNYGPCPNSFNVKIKIVYHEEGDQVAKAEPHDPCP